MNSQLKLTAKASVQNVMALEAVILLLSVSVELVMAKEQS